ncbi:MAG: SIMPL domain-containing protein [Myxococcota bacterium]|nr:SIMPL domain-containing protein [Myxococcota bacterium]
MNVGATARCTLLSAFVFVACGTGSGEANETDQPTVQVSASGRVQAAPDIVTLNVRVVTENLRSAVAAEENAKTTQAVISALRRAMGKDAEIQTTGYALTPQYEFVKHTSSRRLKGYQARNSVLLRTGDLAGIGRAIDAATDAGANEIDSLVFGLRDDSARRLEALAAATRNARAKADAIAKALGTRVSRVVSVQESGGFPAPVRMQAQFAAKAETPIETGNLELQAQVSMKVELAD